jgi:4-carboxymuconolactone decarboxylase
VGQALGAEYELVTHRAPARQAGVPETVIEAIGAGRALAEFNPDYDLLAEVRDSVLARRSLPETIQGALVAKWGVDGLLELVVLVGFYGMINGILTSFDVPVPRE